MYLPVGVIDHLEEELAKRTPSDQRKPTVFFLPELEARPFWNTNDNDVIASVIAVLEEAVSAIRDEFAGVRHKVPGCLSKHANGGSWNAYYLMREGYFDRSMVQSCPKTVEALSLLPICESSLGYVYFSVLGPGASIHPHHGATNIKLRVQLALEVGGSPDHATEGPVLTVGQVSQKYQEGEVLVFDDTYLHSVTNAFGETERAVLLVDIWHPAVAHIPHLQKQIVDTFPPARGTSSDADPQTSESAVSSSTVISNFTTSSGTMATIFNDFPRHLLLEIFKSASVRELGMHAGVCRRWKALVNTDELWRHLYTTEAFFYPQLDCKSNWKEKVKYQITSMVYFDRGCVEPGRRDYDHVFKILMLGDPGVGKSSFLLRLADWAFTSSYISTIGVDFRNIKCIHRQNFIKLQVWDTAGPERFRTITSAYYRGCNGFFLMFNVDNRQSLNSTQFWMLEILKHSTIENPSVLLLGLKTDKEREVTVEEAHALARHFKVPYAECSPMTGEGVEEAAGLLVRMIARQFLAKVEGGPTQADTELLQRQNRGSPVRLSCSLL